jgi:hypothetical protein
MFPSEASGHICQGFQYTAEIHTQENPWTLEKWMLKQSRHFFRKQQMHLV